MELTYVIAGRVTRDFILPSVGQPHLDAPGGSALYTAGGLLVWDKAAGILARVGEDYPRPWLKEIRSRDLDIEGIQILQKSIDLRAFHAYNEKLELVHGPPITQFARRELTFPKILHGYQDSPEIDKDMKKPDILAPLAGEIPAEYREAKAVHLCPLDFVSHNQLSVAFRAGLTTTLTLDPSAGYMTPAFYRDLRIVIAGLTAFLPSEEELRGLFWDKTHDLWEMSTALGEYGCEIVVIKRGRLGQAVYDVKGKHRWEIPAYPARPADPTGVGDAFCGGFLAGFRKTYDPVQATLYGNVSASLNLEGSGAFYPLDVLSGLAEARLNVMKEMVREV